MARTRSLKPGFFKNEILGQLPIQDQLLFAGLWTLADRAGRLEDRPARIKAEIFPYRDVDIEASLCRLHQTEFIIRYSREEAYIALPTFSKHQSPHMKEQASTIPAPDMPGASTMQAHPYTGLPYTGLPSTLPPDEPEVVVTPSLDDQFQEYRRLFEIVGNPIPEDFANGSFCWRSWNLLDYPQRVTAIDSLKAREAAGVSVLHSASSYLQKLEYKRPLRKAAATNGSGKRDIAAVMLEEERAKRA